MSEAALSPEIEPELRGKIPRPLRLRTRTQVVRFLLPTFFFGVLALLGTALAVDQQQTAQLVKEGRTTEAHVTGKRYYTGKSTDYYLDYGFTANGQPRTGSDSVSHETYDRTPEGSPLTVTYLPSNPGIQRLGTVDATHAAEAQHVTMGIIAVLALFFVGLCAYLERFFRRQLALLQRGTPVRAHLLECSAPEPGTRYPVYSVTYEYEVPGSGTITRTVPLNYGIGKQLEGESTATVLYNPRNPRESNLYLAFEAVTR